VADQHLPRYQSEFPHDNPTLFDGLGWILDEPHVAPSVHAGEALSEALSMRPPEVEEIPPSGPTSDLERFLGAVIGIAFGQGQMRAAAILQGLFEGSDSEIDSLRGAPRALLAQAGFAVFDGDALRLSAHTTQQIAAWRGLLSGQSSHLEACEQTLDEFTSEFVAACLGMQGEQVAETRRLLRRSGVAAFGMLAA
jgi:hypothetical protein